MLTQWLVWLCELSNQHQLLTSSFGGPINAHQILTKILWSLPLIHWLFFLWLRWVQQVSHERIHWRTNRAWSSPGVTQPSVLLQSSQRGWLLPGSHGQIHRHLQRRKQVIVFKGIFHLLHCDDFTEHFLGGVGTKSTANQLTGSDHRARFDQQGNHPTTQRTLHHYWDIDQPEFALRSLSAYDLPQKGTEVWLPFTTFTEIFPCQVERIRPCCAHSVTIKSYHLLCCNRSHWRSRRHHCHITGDLSVCYAILEVGPSRQEVRSSARNDVDHVTAKEWTSGATKVW